MVCMITCVYWRVLKKCHQSDRLLVQFSYLVSPSIIDIPKRTVWKMAFEAFFAKHLFKMKKVYLIYSKHGTHCLKMHTWAQTNSYSITHATYLISPFLKPLRPSFYRKYTSSVFLPYNNEMFIQRPFFARIYTYSNRRNLPIIIILGTILAHKSSDNPSCQDYLVNRVLCCKV